MLALAAVAGPAPGALASGGGQAEPEFGATSPEDKLDIQVGPILWEKPEVSKFLGVHVLWRGSREVGYLAVVPPQIEIRPVLAPRVMPLSRVARDAGGTMALNGAFFNRSDGVPASYIVRNGRTVADPHANRALTGNPKLQPYLKQIFDRPEWRVWMTPAGRRVAFEAHHLAPAPGWKLIHAMQAGPLLLPFLSLQEGAFVRGRDDGIASTKRLGRSAIGLRNDGVTLLVSLPKPPSPGLTILELQTFMASLGVSEAMALDGGEASGFVLRPSDPKALWWGHDTNVRSALVVMAQKADKGGKAGKPAKPAAPAKPAHGSDPHGHGK